MAFLASAGCFWCEGPVKPEGDVPGSVSFTGTLPSGVGATPGVGATQGVRAPGRGLSLPGRIQDIKNRRVDAFRLIIYSRILQVMQYRPRGYSKTFPNNCSSFFRSPPPLDYEERRLQYGRCGELASDMHPKS